MKELHYKIKTIRMDERTWEKLKDKRKKSGKSWNLYILDLIEKKKQLSTIALFRTVRYD